MKGTESRLRRLEMQVDELSTDLRVLRTLVDQDHASALNKIRYVTEKVLHRLCREHEVTWGKGEPTLENMIGPLLAAKIIPKNVGVHVRTVQTNASPGSHYQEHALTATHVQVAQIALIEFLEWYYQSAAEPLQSDATSERKSQRSWIIPLAALAGVAAIAIGARAFLGDAKPPDNPPAPALKRPEAGLATIERYRNPKGSEISNLGSSPMWAAAAKDFAGASEQPGAPAEWRAARYFSEGNLHLVAGDVDAAVASMHRAIDADPSWAVGHTGLASALARNGEIDAALAASQEAQRLEPGWAGAIASAARVYTTATRGNDAIQEYRRALAISPNDPVLVAELALVYHAMRMDAEAERFAKQALDLDPDMVSARVLLAERALENGDAVAARSEAERAVAVSPKSLSAKLALADALSLAGLEPDALEVYRQAMELAKIAPPTGGTLARFEAIRDPVMAGKLPPPRVDKSDRAMKHNRTMNRKQPDRSMKRNTNDPLFGF